MCFKNEVRLAVESDVQALMEMGRIFHSMAYSDVSALDEHSARQLLIALIRSPRGLVLTNGHGAIGGVLTPGWFQANSLVMEEAFWWSARGGRDLLRCFLSRARAMGATSIMLSTLENERFQAADRIVRSFGFKSIERRYILKVV